MLGPTLTSIHNLRFFQRFIARLRELIQRGDPATINREFPIAASDSICDCLADSDPGGAETA